ncbi:MAG: hypothetical protein ABSD49_01650 [Candidatus Bathyarchaeia archaeon]
MAGETGLKVEEITDGPSSHTHRSQATYPRQVAFGTPWIVQFGRVRYRIQLLRFLNDLITWTLQGKIWHRQASVCRSIIEMCLRVEGFEEAEGKLDEIEEELEAVKKLRQQTEKGQEEIVAGFINQLPSGLRDQIIVYGREQARLEQ